MREKRISDLTISLAMIQAIVATFSLAALALFIVGWGIGVERVKVLQDFLSVSGSMVISLLTISGGILVLAFLVMFICWLCRDEGMMILPFEVAAGEEKYSGKALSQLLTAELLRISRIHGPKVEYMAVNPYESEKLNMPELSPASGFLTYTVSQLVWNVEGLRPIVLTGEDLTYTVSQLGPVGLGTTSIHIGPLMAILKKLWPKGDNGQVIYGSLQRYGSVISLVACLENKEINAWEVKTVIDGYGQKADEKIPGLVKDLSFKIIHDLRHGEISAKTWQGFKHFTEALDAYHQYNLTGSIEDLESARTECLKAGNCEIGYEKLLQLLYNLGITYYNKKEYFIAEELFLQILKIKSDESFAFLALGNLFLAQNRQDKALEYFERAIELNPQYFRSWLGKGIALSNLGRIEEAIEAYKIAIRIGTKIDNLIWCLIGLFLFYDLGRTEEAIEAYEKAIEIDPQDSGSWLYNSWLHKGIALSKLGRTEEAIEAYEKAAEVDQENVSAWYEMGNNLSKLGRTDEAVKAYEKVAKTDPEGAIDWCDKGDALDKLGRAEEAIVAYKKVVKFDPKDAVSWFLRGYSLDKLSRTEEAVEAYEKGIEIDPYDSEAWHNKSIALENLGRTKEAIEACNKAVEIDPQHSTAHISLAHLYRKLEKEVESAKQCKIARNLIETESEYTRACFEAVCGSADAALALLRTALENKQVTPKYARRDPDFEFIRDNPRFEALLDEFSEDGKKGPK